MLVNVTHKKLFLCFFRTMPERNKVILIKDHIPQFPVFLQFVVLSSTKSVNHSIEHLTLFVDSKTAFSFWLYSLWKLSWMPLSFISSKFHCSTGSGTWGITRITFSQVLRQRLTPFHFSGLLMLPFRIYVHFTESCLCSGEAKSPPFPDSAEQISPQVRTNTLEAQLSSGKVLVRALLCFLLFMLQCHAQKNLNDVFSGINDLQCF